MPAHTKRHRVLLATIRDGSEYICPRCLVPKAKLDNTGFLRDSQLRVDTLRVYATDKVRRARDFIYQQGKPVDGVAVRRLLDSESLVPIMVLSGGSFWDLLP